MGDEAWKEVSYKKRRAGFDKFDLPSIQTKPYMWRYRSKQYDLEKISVSVFITNIPDSCSAKELFNACKQYGHVMDSFVPNKRSKAGKHFGFVKFINVFNEERLVDNLGTIWIGRYRLHANLAKFKRPTVGGAKKVGNETMGSKSNSGPRKSSVRAKDFQAERPSENVPYDECLVNHNLDLVVMGEVKDFHAINNLYCVLSKEGFLNVNIAYLGGLWVIIELSSAKSKEKFMNQGIKNMEYSSEDDLHLHGDDNNADAFKEMNGDDDSEVEGVLDTIFGDQEVNSGQNFTHYKGCEEQSPLLEHEKDTSRVMEDAHHVNVHASPRVESKTKTGGSVLEILDGIIKVGHAMGFNMEGCINEMKIIIDHRPILLREVVTDYGPIPFRFYHSWFSFEGFNQMVRETWNNIVLEDHIDTIVDSGGANEDILLSRVNLLKEVHDIQNSINQEGLQKAKIKWAVEGDENSKFFHRMINRRRANLAVKGIMVDGEWVDDPTCVKDEFKSHFASRFQAPNSNRCCLNFTFPKCLDTIQAEELESPISIEEVRKAVRGCGDNKSPGPDGFTAEFFRKYWYILGSDLYDAVVWFFDNGSFARGCNTSFITLIPKIQDPKFVSDYRPISLIGCLYKVITKVIANRLSLIISDLISDVKSAFLPNRQILDGPFIINELLFWCKFKKQQAMVFKVDFEKAYDSVRWDFLQDILTAFGFGPKWCSWIRGCLQSATASVLLNGSLTFEFQLQAVDAGIFKGLNIETSFTMSHLFYADDTINLKKSHLLGVGLTNEVIEAAAENLGCAAMKTPFKYLGVMVGGNCSKVQAWEDTISEVKARLYNWKLKALSIRGVVWLRMLLGAFAGGGIYLGLPLDHMISGYRGSRSSRLTVYSCSALGRLAEERGKNDDVTQYDVESKWINIDGEMDNTKVVD
nr:RNA-directed DNA polymerase, eukaryota [Tanacetum cinerariifolium]